ncbi:hypothetical protein M3Y99_00609200 [Aphelenchoides fujianensis]|nr:hypothetical protein M3Y99_00609200 [Aphelenchoides fujianensis]
MDGIPPPPGHKPRSMNSSLPTYRDRPSGGTNAASHFANAKSLFESFNTPAVRNGLSQLAKNPLAQRAAVSIAKNDAARTAAVNAAQTAATGREPDPFVSKMAHGSIASMVKQFEDKPVMRMGAAANGHTRGAASHFDQKVEPSYNSLTAIDPFEYPPQLPSTFDNRSKSSEPFGYGGFCARKKSGSLPPAAARRSATRGPIPNIASPVEPLTNQAHGVAKYPYRPSQSDELSVDPGDTLAVDDQWVHATNTRTGASGILPVNFIDVKIPLAPQPSTLRFAPSAAAAPATVSTTWTNKQVMKAVYDFDSGVDGDLQWYNGELKGKFGILPANYVQPIDGSTGGPIPTSPVGPSSSTVTALYDYTSGVAEDLQFKAGDVIEVVSEVNAEWINGRLGARTGLVPLTFVQRN